MGSKLRTASWILLALLGTLTLVSSLASVNIAYFQEDDLIGGPEGINLSELAADRADVRTALKARRGTAAAFGAGYAILFLFLVLGPLSPRGTMGVVGRPGWHPRCRWHHSAPRCSHSNPSRARGRDPASRRRRDRSLARRGTTEGCDVSS